MDFNYMDSFTSGRDIKINFKRNRISPSSRPAPATSSGGAMLIIIFVVLCLTVFGFLAFSTAFADRKLTDKNIKNQVEFYSADSEAELKIAKIYGELYNLPTDADWTGLDSIAGANMVYDSETGVITVDFITGQNENHAIYTCADFYVDDRGQWDYKITSWYSYFTDELDYTQIYDVWSGE